MGAVYFGRAEYRGDQRMLKKGLKAKYNSKIGTQHGFTMIELLSVMIIIGVVVTVAIKKLDLLSDSASITALQTGIRELRSRESVAWFKIKLSDTGYTTDGDVYNSVDKNIGQGYSWDPGPAIGGGRLHFKAQSVNLTRAPSSPNAPGSWM